MEIANDAVANFNTLLASGDYAKSAILMPLADNSHFLQQKTDVFIGKVRKTMSPSEIESVPTDNEDYINCVIAKSLDNVDVYHRDLADLVVARYYLSPNAERFIYDPTKKGTLFVDEKGELITLLEAEISTVAKEAPESSRRQVVNHYSKSFVWTGPQAEQEFTPQEKPIPEPTLPTSDLFVGRQERTKISPQMRINMLYQKIRERSYELGHPISTPTKRMEYANEHIKFALENIDLLQGDLAETIAFLYHYSPIGEKFIKDPYTGGTLFVDQDQNIVVVNEAQFQTSQKDGTQYIASYKSCSVLNGADKGKSFTPSEKPLSSPQKPHQYQVLAK